MFFLKGYDMQSDNVKKGFQRAPHRGLLHACGLSNEDIKKPFIGIANSCCDIVPGHVHLEQVGKIVKKAIQDAGVQLFNLTLSLSVTALQWAIQA